MKISRIEFENFRNFRDKGEIRCSTDGKVTIIYGRNGDGKTTLHQLFQWIFYGVVHFNKTATSNLYNLDYASNIEYGREFSVKGRIDFEHCNIKYSLMREYKYRKGIDQCEKIDEYIQLLVKDTNDNWKPLTNPQEVVETLLPSGLSDYFFFDGESMIADLKVRGTDSAKKLRKALYSIFDLDILENALGHIGDIEYKTTALGKLYLSKSGSISDNKIAICKENIKNAQDKIEDYKQQKSKVEYEKKQNLELITQISEKIGNTKSSEDYEKIRKEYIIGRDTSLNNIKIFQKDFGDTISRIYPQMLISTAVDLAKQKIQLKVENTKLPHGLTKELIHYLSNESSCICGNPICSTERQHINDYLKIMPPRSYAQVYQEFSLKAKQWKVGYNREKLDSYLINIIKNSDTAKLYDYKIKRLDEEQKKSLDIVDLIIDRKKAEEKIEELSNLITTINLELKKYEIYHKREMGNFDTLTEQTNINNQINYKINILNKVKNRLLTKKNNESIQYSKSLEENIQQLINKMLTSKRDVRVSPEFSIKVFDSHGDESKSEGQFAVVSFAYIGGIFRLIFSENNLTAKEYPLVLDGPFSKLDPIQKQNVINEITQFAPQVILFSKDSLQEDFEKGLIGSVWTIISNDEKNISYIEEGYKWK
jgi:hypothetical protein